MDVSKKTNESPPLFHGLVFRAVCVNNSNNDFIYGGVL